VGDEEDDALREVTRDLRRQVFLSETLDLVLHDLRQALKAPETDADRALRAVIVRYLGDAWSDGARKEADLRTAVQTLQSQVELLKKMNRELLARVSRER